ncbi:hypothetical protein HHI36_019423 [Cryptolaemus montrouzieri]|uniref:Uncharacterized protein n=1 Tax=Cryptolaemus montrouzieri TaxID=559131 RepID=A0ABD2P346_9CUCU
MTICPCKGKRRKVFKWKNIEFIKHRVEEKDCKKNKETINLCFEDSEISDFKDEKVKFKSIETEKCDKKSKKSEVENYCDSIRENKQKKRDKSKLSDNNNFSESIINLYDDAGSEYDISDFKSNSQHKKKKSKKFEKDVIVQDDTKTKSIELDKRISDILSARIEALLGNSVSGQNCNEVKKNVKYDEKSKKSSNKQNTKIDISQITSDSSISDEDISKTKKKLSIEEPEGEVTKVVRKKKRKKNLEKSDDEHDVSFKTGKEDEKVTIECSDDSVEILNFNNETHLSDSKNEIITNLDVLASKETFDNNEVHTSPKKDLHKKKSCLKSPISCASEAFAEKENSLSKTNFHRVNEINLDTSDEDSDFEESKTMLKLKGLFTEKFDQSFDNYELSKCGISNKKDRKLKESEEEIINLGSNITSKEICGENSDILSCIFTKTENDSRDNYSDVINESVKLENSYDSPEDKVNLHSTSFSFGDILSQSHNDKLMEKFNEIMLDSTSKNNSPIKRSKENSKSVISVPEILETKDKSKGKMKQKTLDKFVRTKSDINKRKVIELLRESRSINEIEEELDISHISREEVQQLDIVTPWSIPLMHRIAFYVSNHPSASQRRDLKAAGLEPKTGKFTKDEDRQILQNWREFCEQHEWNEDNYEPFLKGSFLSKRGVLGKNQLHKFVQYISHGLDDRLMYSVYSRFQRLFLSQKEWESGRFTSEDDRIILDYVDSEKSNAPFVDLEDILKRSRKAILKRFQLLQSKRKLKSERVFWNKELTEQLMANIIEVTCSANLSELKYHQVTTQEWQKISKRMNISVEKLKRAWVYNFHPRFFNDKYVDKVAEAKKKLVDLISARYTDWREINWHELSKEFDDTFSNAKLCKLLKDMVSISVPPNKRTNLQEVIKYLKDRDGAKKSHDRLNFVEDILKETKNGTVIPKINKKCEENQQENNSESSESEDLHGI